MNIKNHRPADIRQTVIFLPVSALILHVPVLLVFGFCLFRRGDKLCHTGGADVLSGKFGEIFLPGAEDTFLAQLFDDDPVILEKELQ